MTSEEKLAEEYICNGKCQDDISKNYAHCKTCTRPDDFLAGLKRNKEQLIKAKEIIKGLLIILYETATDEYDFEKACPYQYKEIKDFLKEVETDE